MANSKDWVSDEALAALTIGSKGQNTLTGGSENPISLLPGKSKTTSNLPLGSDSDDYSSVIMRTTKYPWNLWLDGEWHTAVRGKDFTVTVGTFQIMLSNYATRRGLFVLSNKNVPDDAVPSVVFKAFATKAEREATKAAIREAKQKAETQPEEEEYDDGYGDVLPEDIA